RDVDLRNEPEHLPVEGERPILVLDVDAHERDSHGGSPPGSGEFCHVGATPRFSEIARRNGCLLIPSARSSRAVSPGPAHRPPAHGMLAASTPPDARTPR